MTGYRIKEAQGDKDVHWWHRGLCWPDYALFDSLDAGDIAEAKRVCKACPVKAECLEDALKHESAPGASRHGVRGGLDPDQRAGRRGDGIEHGTPKGYRAHLKRGETACDPCLLAERARGNERYQARKASA